MRGWRNNYQTKQSGGSSRKTSNNFATCKEVRLETTAENENQFFECVGPFIKGVLKSRPLVLKVLQKMIPNTTVHHIIANSISVAPNAGQELKWSNLNKEVDIIDKCQTISQSARRYDWKQLLAPNGDRNRKSIS